MTKRALATILLLCAAAAAAQGSPAAEVYRAAGESGLPAKQPHLIADARSAGSSAPAVKPGRPAAEPPAAARAEDAREEAAGAVKLPDFSRLERASGALHLWLGLALALLALTEAFAADNPGRARISLAGCALSAALALGALAAAAAALGPSAGELLAFRPGFLLYYAAALLAASAALAQLLSRRSGSGAGFWGGAAAFFLAAAGAVLLAVHARVNPEAAASVMAGHVPIGAALLAAGVTRAFLLFSSAAPARAALAVFLFIAAAMSGLYKESPASFALRFSTVTEAGTPAGGAEKAATGRANEEAADKKGPRG